MPFEGAEDAAQLRGERHAALGAQDSRCTKLFVCSWCESREQSCGVKGVEEDRQQSVRVGCGDCSGSEVPRFDYPSQDGRIRCNLRAAEKQLQNRTLLCWVTGAQLRALNLIIWEKPFEAA